MGSSVGRPRCLTSQMVRKVVVQVAWVTRRESILGMSWGERTNASRTRRTRKPNKALFGHGSPRSPLGIIFPHPQAPLEYIPARRPNQNAWKSHIYIVTTLAQKFGSYLCIHLSSRRLKRQVPQNILHSAFHILHTHTHIQTTTTSVSQSSTPSSSSLCPRLSTYRTRRGQRMPYGSYDHGHDEGEDEDEEEQEDEDARRRTQVEHEQAQAQAQRQNIAKTRNENGEN